MTVSDDAKRAARRNRQFHSARDFETSSSQIGDPDPLAEDIKGRAQRIVAGNARGRSKAARVADAEMLMRMLGVHPEDGFDPSLSVMNPSPHPTATR